MGLWFLFGLKSLTFTHSGTGYDLGRAIFALNPKFSAAIRGLGIPGDIKMSTLRAVRLTHVSDSKEFIDRFLVGKKLSNLGNLWPASR